MDGGVVDPEAPRCLLAAGRPLAAVAAGSQFIAVVQDLPERVRRFNLRHSPLFRLVRLVRRFLRSDHRDILLHHR